MYKVGDIIKVEYSLLDHRANGSIYRISDITENIGTSIGYVPILVVKKKDFILHKYPGWSHLKELTFFPSDTRPFPQYHAPLIKLLLDKHENK